LPPAAGCTWSTTTTVDDLTAETGRWWIARIREQLAGGAMTIQLLTATNGRPQTARCNICLARWSRPDDFDDDQADKAITDFAVHHRSLHGAR
jgi:hypothetical protein